MLTVLVRSLVGYLDSGVLAAGFYPAYLAARFLAALRLGWRHGAGGT